MPTLASCRWPIRRGVFAAVLTVCPGATLLAFIGCSGSEPDQQLRRATKPDIAVELAGQNIIVPWAGWRGGDKQGVADSRNADPANVAENFSEPVGSQAQSSQSLSQLPLRWTVTSGHRWKQRVDGAGNSSPVVTADAIFLTSAQLKDNGTLLELLCFDRTTGRLRWAHDVATIDHSPTHVKNGHASATPATDGQRVCVSFGSAGLFCFDLEGHRLWHAPLGTMNHEWGVASSPVIVGDRVIQLCDHGSNSYLAAFDLESGDQVWRTARASHGSWSTPATLTSTVDGKSRTELIVNGNGTSDVANGEGGGWLTAYDPDQGRELWRARGTADVVCPTPIVAGDLIISSSGRNGPIFGVRAGGAGDVTKSHVAWRFPRGGAYVPTGLAYQGRLYMISDSGVIQCLRSATGETVWRDRLRGTFTASLVAGDGQIYATSEQGVVYVVRAGGKFELLSTNRIDERCLATPAIAQGELIVRTESHLYCFGGPSLDDPAMTSQKDGSKSGSPSDENTPGEIAGSGATSDSPGLSPFGRSSTGNHPAVLQSTTPPK